MYACCTSTKVEFFGYAMQKNISREVIKTILQWSCNKEKIKKIVDKNGLFLLLNLFYIRYNTNCNLNLQE